MSITLHKRLGVNARITFCRKCGGPSSELLMLGNKNHVGTCPDHGLVIGIGVGTQRCIADGCNKYLSNIRELADYEKLPSPNVCNTCMQAMANIKRIIDEGGIAWRCVKCNSEGAFTLSKSTKGLIESVRVKGALGVEYGNNEDELCPKCSGAEMTNISDYLAKKDAKAEAKIKARSYDKNGKAKRRSRKKQC